MYKKAALTAALAGLLFLSPSADAAPFLSVDFGPGGVESGFVGQNAASVVHSTAEGDVTVTSGGSFFNRGAGGPNAALYTDFTFLNNAPGGMLFTLSGPGIEANTDYEMKFWSYDANNGGKNHAQSYAGESGTVGSAGPIIYPNGSPTDLDSFSAVGTFTSDGAGLISIRLTDVATGGNGQSEPRLNGLQISVVPEPGSLALLGLGGLLIARRRRA